MMRMFCRIGWHKWRVYGHRLGNPWVFHKHCLRCGKHRDDAYQLPPQPIPRLRRPEPHPDFSTKLG